MHFIIICQLFWVVTLFYTNFLKTFFYIHLVLNNLMNFDTKLFDFMILLYKFLLLLPSHDTFYTILLNYYYLILYYNLLLLVLCDELLTHHMCNYKIFHIYHLNRHGIGIYTCSLSFSYFASIGSYT